MAKQTGKKTLAKPNPRETVRDVVGALDQAQITPFPKDFFNQILGSALNPSQPENSQEDQTESGQTEQAHSGELVEGDWMLLTNAKQFEKQRAVANETHSKKVDIEAGIEYHREIKHFDKKAINDEASETRRQVEEIMNELKKLINSSKMLQQQFVEIGVDEHIPNVGKYHVNFLEWMLSVVQAARQNVEDAGNWLGSTKHKNDKKSKGYWGMFKKHGTSFGLSNERQVATNVG